jgi:RNA polymerase sigma-70 factor
MAGGEEALALEIAAMYDFDLALAKATHRAFFSQAIAAAVRSHPDRRMIQLTFLAGVSMSQVGKMYNINQSTVSRRIKSATNSIFQEVLRETQKQFGLTESEANSFLALFMSQLDLHLSILETEHSGA